MAELTEVLRAWHLALAGPEYEAPKGLKRKRDENWEFSPNKQWKVSVIVSLEAEH